MRERLSPPFGPEVPQILALARHLTGKQLVVKRQLALSGEARAQLVRPQLPSRPYEIHYAAGNERVLPHLLAHEVGHLVRLSRVPEEERLMPIISPASRQLAAEQLLPEFDVVLRHGIPEEAFPSLFLDWHQDLITQLANFPADLRIEAWIHQRFPTLRPVQERSLVFEVRRGFPSLAPFVAALTPSTVYRAAMAMNAAQAYQVAELFAAPRLMDPFDRCGFSEQGQALARVALEAPDEGHCSDMTAVNTWAQELGLTGWFSWEPSQGSR